MSEEENLPFQVLSAGLIIETEWKEKNKHFKLHTCVWEPRAHEKVRDRENEAYMTF